LTPNQKNLLIFGALVLGFLFFMSLYSLSWLLDIHEIINEKIKTNRNTIGGFPLLPQLQ
jgi:hypothetical protein